MNNISELPDVPELCGRLLRESNAQVVLILGEEGEILGHAGQPGALADPVVDAIADATAETLNRPARTQPPPDPDDHVGQVGSVQICAAPVGDKAVLAVVFDETSNLALVRLRMKRAREQILRSLETGG